MNGRRVWHRWGWPLGALVVALVVVMLAPQFGFTKTAKGSLWTEQPVVSAPPRRRTTAGCGSRAS